jgi:hypothetical protein
MVNKNYIETVDSIRIRDMENLNRLKEVIKDTIVGSSRQLFNDVNARLVKIGSYNGVDI